MSNGDGICAYCGAVIMPTDEQMDFPSRSGLHRIIHSICYPYALDNPDFKSITVRVENVPVREEDERKEDP